MAWPSDGLNDSEYWQLIPKNIELLIARYPVSGSLNLKDLKKEANLSNMYEVIKKLHVKKLNSLILCDFASSVLNENYISNSELFLWYLKFSNDSKISSLKFTIELVDELLFRVFE